MSGQLQTTSQSLPKNLKQQDQKILESSPKNSQTVSNEELSQAILSGSQLADEAALIQIQRKLTQVAQLEKNMMLQT